MRKESNLDMAVSKADALAGSRGFKEPHFIRIHKPLEILDFENRPNSRSPELWRELSNSENNGRALPIRSPELKSEIAANTGLNCKYPRAENKRLRRSCGARGIRTVGAIYLYLSAPDHN
jgi:hypothetical protein